MTLLGTRVFCFIRRRRTGWAIAVGCFCWFRATRPTIFGMARQWDAYCCRAALFPLMEMKDDTDAR